MSHQEVGITTEELLKFAAGDWLSPGISKRCEDVIRKKVKELGISGQVFIASLQQAPNYFFGLLESDGINIKDIYDFASLYLGIMKIWHLTDRSHATAILPFLQKLIDLNHEDVPANINPLIIQAANQLNIPLRQKSD